MYLFSILKHYACHMKRKSPPILKLTRKYFVNPRLKSKSSINCLQHADGSMTHSNTEMANVFNNHFASVYTRSSVPSFHLDHTVPTLNDVDITPSIVLDRLEKINVNKSSEPDGWPLLSLKETAVQLSVPLCTLFKKSLSSSCLPSSWKHAHVTPIHKKGNRSTADNYRPISLTSPIIQILESIIKDHITHQMFIFSKPTWFHCWQVVHNTASYSNGLLDSITR